MRWQWAQWFEKRWWNRYLRHKPVEDYAAWKTSYWVNFLHKINLVVSEEQKVLDAGCGPAGVFTAIRSKEVIAIDPLLSHYQQLPHFEASKHPHVLFQEMRLEDIQYSNAFDVVFCLNVINHVEDLDGALRNLVAALKSGGKLVLSIDAHRFLLPKYLFRGLPIDILHPHQYDKDEYLEMCASLGLRCVKEELIKPGNLFDYYAFVFEKV